MKRILKRNFAPLLLAGLAGGWSAPSLACTYEPYISSVCVMAAPRVANGFGNGAYIPAAGQVLATSQYQALFSLLGATYGGNGQTTFGLPDLRGRVIIGAGQGTGLPAYTIGQSGGAATVTLTTTQLPAHSHTLAAATTTFALGTLAATTSLAGVTATAAGSGLSLRGSDQAGNSANSSGSALGTAPGAQGKLYYNGTTAPNVTMAAGSIGGTAPVTFAGTPTTSLSGAPVITVSGTTSPAGSGQAFSIMPPYLALVVMIATQGVYPTLD